MHAYITKLHYVNMKVLYVFGNYRYALVEAIKHCRIAIVDSLLDTWTPDSLNQHHMTEELLRALCKSLLVLASHEEARSIQQVLSTFDLYEHELLWHRRYAPGPRLLYLLLSSPSAECIELGESLTKKAASFLCHTLLHSSLLTDGLYFSSINLRVTKLLHKKLFRDIIDLLKICSQHPTKLANSDIFSYVCGEGMYNLVSFFLEHLKPADLEFLTCIRENSPLCHAASSGHHDTIKLLAEYGFKPPSSEDPPLYRYLRFLIKSKTTCPHRVSLCHTPKCLLHSNTGTKKQNAILDILLPSQEYLHEILNKNGFPFSHLVQIMELEIAERILLEVLSVYRTDIVLTRDVDWESIAFHFSFRIFKFSIQKLEKMGSLMDSFLVEISPTVSYENNVCLYTAKAGMWGFTNLMLQRCEDLAAADRNYLSKVLTLATKRGSIETLQIVYSIITTSDHWVHSQTHQFITVAAQYKQADIVAYLFSQIKTKLPEALISVVKFGDVECWLLAVKQVLHCQPNLLEDNLLSLVTTASLYNRKDLLSQIVPHFFSSNLATGYEEKQVLLYTTSFKAAVKRGHVDLALNALETIPNHLLHRVTDNSSFHSILYWCCYWGSVEVLERLPFTAKQLLHRESPTDCTPWECALAHGHVGKISQLANAPSLSMASSISLSEGNPMNFEVKHLMLGVFSRLMSISQSSGSTTFVSNYCPFGREYGTFFHKYDDFNVYPEACIAVLLCLGKYAGEFICLRHIHFMDPVLVINQEAFETLLDALQEANLLQEYFTAVNTKDSECFARIVASGSVQRVKALLSHGVDILACDEHYHLEHSGSLLCAAVQTKDPEMVELILSVCGDRAPEACFKENSEKEYPLYLAFALGATSVLSQTSLLHTAYKVNSQDTNWILESSKARGWFPLYDEKQ